MRLTPVLFVRHWLAKLHPPLPRTPRESQQLLWMLEGSFRKHLDEVHPSPAQRQPDSVSPRDIPLNSPISASSATHHHLGAVLNNPLLAKPIERKTEQASLVSRAVTTFSKAAHEGRATIPLLCSCAGDYLKGLKNSGETAVEDRLTPKIAAWIHTLNPPRKREFFSSFEALDLTVQVTGADQQEAVAWEWLRMLYERDFFPEELVRDSSMADLKWLSAEDVLVSHVMRLSIRRGELSDAAQQYVEACQYRSVSERATVRLEDASTTLDYVPLERSWKRLAASIIHYKGRHSISEGLFDRMISYGMSWSLVPEFSTPIVMVYHPTLPSASSLFEQLHNRESSFRFLSQQVKASKRFRRAILMVILDGAQLSLTQGLRQQAQFLLDFAHTHYTEFLPPLPKKESVSLRAQIQTAQGELKAHSYNFAWT